MPLDRRHFRLLNGSAGLAPRTRKPHLGSGAAASLPIVQELVALRTGPGDRGDDPVRPVAVGGVALQWRAAAAPGLEIRFESPCRWKPTVWPLSADRHNRGARTAANSKDRPHAEYASLKPAQGVLVRAHVPARCDVPIEDLNFVAKPKLTASRLNGDPRIGAGRLT